MKNPTLFKTILSSIMIFFIAGSVAQNNSAESKYRVTAYQKGGNQIVSLSNEVNITPAAAFYIPNAFTPNDDGLNDSFGLIGEGVTEYNLQIFNRWGNLIFESNDMKTQWDGNYQNVKAEIGAYVYKITGKGSSNNGKSSKLINMYGTVTLVL